MLNNEKIREKCTEFSDSNDTKVCTKSQFAVTFGPQPWALRCVLALDCNASFALNCVVGKISGFDRFAPCIINSRQCAAGSFLGMRGTNPYVAQFEEINSVGLASTKIRIWAKRPKFLTGSIEMAELICLFLWFQIRPDLRCLASQVSNIRMHCLSVINKSSNASPGLFLASKQIASFIPYSFLINLEMLAVQGPTTVASLVRWWK